MVRQREEGEGGGEERVKTRRSFPARGVSAACHGNVVF